MDNLENLIGYLDWDNPKYLQDYAIKKLLTINENQIIFLAQQFNHSPKSEWENIALILKIIGYPRNKGALPYLMEMFQDVNWPGVLTIVDLLKEIDIKILMPFINNAISKTIETNDAGWAFGLVFLIKRLNIKEEYLEKDKKYKKLYILSEEW